ncbi:MAG: YecH family protein [Bdellovibrionales bacterium]|nr:YecH family protein [Bdellovibrionales bacterium]
MSKSLAAKSKHFHAHDVMHLLAGQNRALAVSEIKSLILEKFGLDADFGSCSVDGMDADQVIQFLLDRQKISEVEPGKFMLEGNHSCGH